VLNRTVYNHQNFIIAQILPLDSQLCTTQKREENDPSKEKKNKNRELKLLQNPKVLLLLLF